MSSTVTVTQGHAEFFPEMGGGVIWVGSIPFEETFTRELQHDKPNFGQTHPEGSE